MEFDPDVLSKFQALFKYGYLTFAAAVRRSQSQSSAAYPHPCDPKKLAESLLPSNQYLKRLCRRGLPQSCSKRWLNSQESRFDRFPIYRLCSPSLRQSAHRVLGLLYLIYSFGTYHSCTHRTLLLATAIRGPETCQQALTHRFAPFPRAVAVS